MHDRDDKLTFKALHIHTQHDNFVYMHKDSHVCVSEGFESLTRITVAHGDQTIIASLNVIESDILARNEISLSTHAATSLGVSDGDQLIVSHLEPIDSIRHVRKKIYGQTLNEDEIFAIIDDIANGRFSNVELAAFVAACGGNDMSTPEVIALTRAMVRTGKKLQWANSPILDKHCVGGLPGNRTTPIVVAIIAACGLTMPKTSSRAITSPAGTADTLETITTVNLTSSQIQQVVTQEHGCFAWGGTANLSPADDILIRVEKALDLDSTGQLIASILSKKIAAGSTHVLIDLPVGPTAKFRTTEAAVALKHELESVAQALDLKIQVVITDGMQPVGRGIGPSLEARDVLAVLRNDNGMPQDLRDRAVFLAGQLLELANITPIGSGSQLALETIVSGSAYQKFLRICHAQGGFREPTLAQYTVEISAQTTGKVTQIDNRRLAKIAKLAGAPNDKCAGVDFFAPLGTMVNKGQILYVIHAESEGEMAYALRYLNSQEDIITIEPS